VVVLYALVPGLILLDLVNGFLKSGASTDALSIGQVIRGIITLWAGVTVIRIRSRALRGFQVWYLGLAALGVIGPLLAVARVGREAGFLFDLMTLSKALFGPGLILILVLAFRRHRLALEDVLGAIALVGAIAGASIVVLNILNLGQATYIWQGVGFKGYFISQNEVGLTMGLSLFASLELLLLEPRPRYFVAAVLTVVGMVLLGTRAASLGAILIPVAVLAVNLRSLMRGRSGPGIGWLVLLFGMLTMSGVWEYSKIGEQRFLQSKFVALTESKVILVRGVLLFSALRYVAHRDLTWSVVGEGPTAYERGVARTMGLPVDLKAAEVDWLDFFGSFGLLFTISIYGFYVGFVRRVRTLRDQYARSVYLVTLMMLGWFLAHGVVAGHAVGSTMPTSALAPILAYAWVLAERQRSSEFSTLGGTPAETVASNPPGNREPH